MLKLVPCQIRLARPLWPSARAAGLRSGRHDVAACRLGMGLAWDG
jgi:hypothetical protein